MILSQILELVPEESLNQIKTSILKILDEKIKNRYYINKHFQNAIMNYFLEDYGSFYLRDQFDKQSNREVRRYLTSLSVERGYKGTKYMIMMNIYFDVHKSFDLIGEYRQLLKNVALQENTFHPDSQEYISHAWKKAFGLFVLAHSFDRNLTSIFDIWNSLFLDQKIFRKRRPNSKTSYSNSIKINQIALKNKIAKNIETESEEESALSQTDKETNQKTGVKQEFVDNTPLSCITVPNMKVSVDRNNNNNLINNISSEKQKSLFENPTQYINNSESTSDSISYTSNNLPDYTKDQRLFSQNIFQQNNPIFAQLQYPQSIPHQTSQLIIQGQTPMNYPSIQLVSTPNGNLFSGVASPFAQQAYFINPQQMMINQQQMMTLQQQQQLIHQQYQQQMMLFEQQKQFNFLMASQHTVPQAVGMM